MYIIDYKQHVFGILIILLLLGGCTAMELRDAQDHFSKGSRIESEQTLHNVSGYRNDSTAVAYASALTEYRLAYAIVNEVIDKKASELKEDGLLGTAYMLKAYSLWRINALMEEEQDTYDAVPAGNGDPVNVTTDETTRLDNIDQFIAFLKSKEDSLSLGKRDAIMLEALPGLIDHERGRASTSWDVAHDYFKSAYCSMGKAADGAPEDHPVRSYLYMSMVQTLGAMRTKLFAFYPRREAAQEWSSQKDKLDHPLCGLEPNTKADSNLNALLTEQLRAIGATYSDHTKDCPVTLHSSCN